MGCTCHDFERMQPIQQTVYHCLGTHSSDVTKSIVTQRMFTVFRSLCQLPARFRVAALTTRVPVRASRTTARLGNQRNAAVWLRNIRRAASMMHSVPRCELTTA